MYKVFHLTSRLSTRSPLHASPEFSNVIMEVYVACHNHRLFSKYRKYLLPILSKPTVSFRSTMSTAWSYKRLRKLVWTPLVPILSI